MVTAAGMEYVNVLMTGLAPPIAAEIPTPAASTTTLRIWIIAGIIF